LSVLGDEKEKMIQVKYPFAILRPYGPRF